MMRMSSACRISVVLSLLLNVNAIYTPLMSPNGTVVNDMGGLLESRGLLSGNNTSLGLSQSGSDDLFGRQVNPPTVLDELALEKETISDRDVYSPKITSPDGSTTWVVGSTVKVTWDTKNPPKHITNPKGKLVLGHLKDDGDENLDIEHPLVEGFELAQGSVYIEVPHVVPSDDYIVVLFGDSGNRSPTFTIN